MQGNWPKSGSMTASQREAWLDVLCKFRKGELKAACALRTDNQTYRPDAYAILEIVNGMRAPSVESRYENNSDSATVRRLAQGPRDTRYRPPIDEWKALVRRDR